MKTRAVCMVVLAFAVVLFLGVSAEAQQLPKRGEYAGKFLHPGMHAGGPGFYTIELDKDHAFFQGVVEGMFMNDAGEGFLHGSVGACPLIGEVTKAGFTGNGYCVLTDQSGDKAFLAWKCGPHVDGVASGCEGDFQWTGGTGKFLGMKGNNRFDSRQSGKADAFIVQWKGAWELP